MIEATYIGHMGSDITVVNAARVSFGKRSGMICVDHVIGKWELEKKDQKLIWYLAEHKHMSPFGHCFATFHVKAPIFVARQLVKHKFLRWNEISRRYVDEKPEFYEPDAWRGRAEDKKQGSEGVVEVKPQHNTYQGDEFSQFGEWWTTVEDHYEDAYYFYEHLLDQGVCPEQARMVLPQSMMTEWYWSGSLDAFADMCNLRCASDTQAETREVATQISDRMRKLFPVSWDALVKVSGHQAETLNRFDEYGNYGENNPPVSSEWEQDSQDKSENLA
jgi:thymidylate synthase (FAD)